MFPPDSSVVEFPTLPESDLGDREKARDLEVRRLEAVTQALWSKRGDPRVAEAIGRLSDRRAKLLGLDAPERREETHKVIDMTMKEAIRELEACGRAAERAKRSGLMIVEGGQPKAVEE